jgi:hypothetical protein
MLVPEKPASITTAAAIAAKTLMRLITSPPELREFYQSLAAKGLIRQDYYYTLKR